MPYCLLWGYLPAAALAGVLDPAPAVAFVPGGQHVFGLRRA